MKNERERLLPEHPRIGHVQCPFFAPLLCARDFKPPARKEEHTPTKAKRGIYVQQRVKKRKIEKSTPEPFFFAHLLEPVPFCSIPPHASGLSRGPPSGGPEGP